MKNKYLILFLLLLISSYTYSQISLGNGANAQVDTCSDTFFDGGGAGADYANSQDGTITICPQTAGDLIQIDFTAFNTEGGGGTCTDYLDMWNANAVGAPGTQDDRFCGNVGAFTIVSTSPDGCVSFQFISNNNQRRDGWEATVTCITPCTPPIAVQSNSATLDICPPGADNPGSLTVAFDGSSSSSPVPGTLIETYEWDFGDGTTAITTSPTASINHTYPATPGIYIAKLSVRDDNTAIDPLGCQSTNAATRIIRVMPEPNFTGTSPAVINVTTCGDSVDLSGIVASQTETQSTPTITAGTTPLPDGTGASYNSTLDFTGFFPVGETVTAGCYPILTFDIEHSFSADLTIDLVAPTGETVRVFDRHGSSFFSGYNAFGTCANNDDDEVAGCPATYTVVGDGSGVAWGGAADPATTTTTTTTCAGYTGACLATSYYLPLVYDSTNSFAAFNGADLNGVWSVVITDNQGDDDGVLSNWSLTFPPTCFNTLETVTPDIVSATWSHTGTGPAVTNAPVTTVVVDPGPDGCPDPGTCTGTQIVNSPTVGPFTTSDTHVYTLTTVDEFGCSYTRDITINVNCTCLLDLTSLPVTETQTVCQNSAITDIVYTAGGDATGVYSNMATFSSCRNKYCL